MNSKSTWIWIAIAAALFAAVVVVEQFGRTTPPALVPLLPNFRAAKVTSVQYTPAGQLEIRADRTNDTWQLVKPVQFPAQAASLDALVVALQQLAPAQTISGAELRQHANADEEFGIGYQKRSTLTLQCGSNASPTIYIGNRTAPGDGVYIQVVGVEGVSIVDAQLLRLLPTKLDDWRDTSLVDLRRLVFDRITVSNATAVLQLQQKSTNQLWQLVYPMPARANNVRLMESLQKLHTTHVIQFVADSAIVDLDNYGFQSPELELTLARGTNLLTDLQFGKSPTNDSTLIYARRVGFPSVFTVERQPLAPWLAPLNDFRDPHLVTLLQPVEEIEVGGGESFTVQRSATNAWRLVDSTLPVDASSVGEFLLALVSAPIQQYKDSITEAEFPKYGLAGPVRTIKLRGRPENGGTNNLLVELSFGAPNDEGLVYVRRTDEKSVYAINIADYARLAISGWKLRDRKLWRFAETNVVRMTLQRAGRKNDLRRLGANSWAPARGTVNGSEVEKIVQQFSVADVAAWVARGGENRTRYGFDTNSLVVTFELKDGTRHEIEFGGKTPDDYPYAAIKLGDEIWICEFPVIPYKRLEWALLNPDAFP